MVPDGNPFSISSNSEAILVFNRKQNDIRHKFQNCQFLPATLKELSGKQTDYKQFLPQVGNNSNQVTLDTYNPMTEMNKKQLFPDSSFLTGIDDNSFSVTQSVRNHAVNRSVDFARINKLSSPNNGSLKRKGKIRDVANLSSLVDIKLEEEMIQTIQRGDKKAIDLVQ